MLLVCNGTAIWLKMAWPLLPLSCTGAVAWLLMANTKRIMTHTTKFLILLSRKISMSKVHTILFPLAAPDLVCPSALNAVNEPPSDGLTISKDTMYKVVPLAGTTASLRLLPEITPLLAAH